MSALRRIRRGLSYSPEYGSHPGIPIGAMLLATSAFVGLVTNGLRGAVILTLAHSAWVIPLLLYGAWERGREPGRG
jgi:hypothetical protein